MTPLTESLDQRLLEFCQAVAAVHEAQSVGDRVARANQLAEFIREVPMDDEDFVLKRLHANEDARDPAKADARFRREVEAMEKCDHAHLLKIVDYNLDEKWFVAPFHPGGKVGELTGTVGDVAETIRRIRPVIAAVAYLHESGKVHRDIKPDNIFVAADDRLVLGDFGLVISTRGDETRLSEEGENVGSWDWMPPWAEEVRLEDIRPTFDVYSLGKVIWAMLTGKRKLKRERFKEPENDVAVLFGSDADGVPVPHLETLNEIFSMCIVDKEEKMRLSNARELLDFIDRLTRQIEQQLDPDPASNKQRPCRVCRDGIYERKVDGSDRHGLHNYGFTSAAGYFRLLECNVCGHIELFHWGRHVSQDRAGPSTTYS